MRTKRSDEERRAWRERMGALAARVRAMDLTERSELAARAGTVTCEGRPLSPFNCVFLALQAGEPPAMVGGIRQWRKAGRCVRKGEHACGRIWVPRSRPEDLNLEPGESTEEHVRFLLIPVFDVAQTDEIESDKVA